MAMDRLSFPIRGLMEAGLSSKINDLRGMNLKLDPWLAYII